MDDMVFTFYYGFGKLWLRNSNLSVDFWYLVEFWKVLLTFVNNRDFPLSGDLSEPFWKLNETFREDCHLDFNKV